MMRTIRLVGADVHSTYPPLVASVTRRFRDVDDEIADVVVTIGTADLDSAVASAGTAVVVLDPGAGDAPELTLERHVPIILSEGGADGLSSVALGGGHEGRDRASVVDVLSTTTAVFDAETMLFAQLRALRLLHPDAAATITAFTATETGFLAQGSWDAVPVSLAAVHSPHQEDATVVAIHRSDRITTIVLTGRGDARPARVIEETASGTLSRPRRYDVRHRDTLASLPVQVDRESAAAAVRQFCADADTARAAIETWRARHR